MNLQGILAEACIKLPLYIFHALFLVLFFSLYTKSLGIVHYTCYADETHLFLSFSIDDFVSSDISVCLSDISTWMKE